MDLQTYDQDTLYRAFVANSPVFDGRFYVAVKTTGIFCRMLCPARKPLKQNCRFFKSVADCLDAGYRPCKRCRPLEPSSFGNETVNQLLNTLQERPEHRWSEADIRDMGFDPSAIRRTFKRQFGMTFLEMARISRIKNGFTAMTNGARVIDAQFDAGFDSPSGFRAAFTRLLGKAPATFNGKDALKAHWIETPLGPMITVADDRSIHLLEFIDRRALPNELKKLCFTMKSDIGIGRTEVSDQLSEELMAFFAGKCPKFETPLTLHGTPFTKSVWNALQSIPPGETRSYGEIAKQIGKPNAVRAVARANGSNQIAIVIPCHRVIGADGSLTGYSGGLYRKQKLIELESAYRIGGQNADTPDKDTLPAS